jgi:hypothetical protein
VLFPPLTVLEVFAIRVEGTVVVAELRPSVAPPSIKSAWEDDCRVERARLKEAEDMRTQAAAAEQGRKQAQWKASMERTRSAALQAKMASTEAALARSEEEKAELEERKRRTDEELERALKEEQQAAGELTMAQRQAASHRRQQTMRLATQLTTAEVQAAAQRARLVKEAKLSADAAAAKAAEEAHTKAQQSFEHERRMTSEKLKTIETKAKTALERAELEAQIKQLEMPKLVERLRMAMQQESHVAVDVCCARLASLVKDDSKQRTKAAVSGALHVLSGVMRSDAHGSDVRTLEHCTSSLASILKASGLQHAAVEAKCLSALARSLNTMERHGLTAIKQIVHKNDEMRAKALAEGIKEEWMPKDNDGKTRPGFDRTPKQ